MAEVSRPATLADVKHKLADLDRVRQLPAAPVCACAAGRDLRSCPIVDSLSLTDDA